MTMHKKGAQFLAMQALGLDLTKEERSNIKVVYEPAPTGTSGQNRVVVDEDNKITFIQVEFRYE